jgi:hypothetical protein
MESAALKTRNRENVLYVFVDKAVMFVISECGTAYKTSDLSPVGICIVLTAC